MTCSNCGQQLGPNDGFCRSCGARRGSIGYRTTVLVILGAIVVLGILAAELQKGQPAPETKAAAAPKPPTSVPAGRFKSIHRLFVGEADDGSDTFVHDNLASETCFEPSDLASSDARLKIETYLFPPTGQASYTLGEMDAAYKMSLIDKEGKVLWSRLESERQKMIPGPGVHLPAGVVFTKNIGPEKTKTLLLWDLKAQACR